MKQKLFIGFLASIFLLAFVSSLTISNIQLGNVNQGQSMNFNVNLNNLGDNNTYTVNFSSVQGLTLPSNITVNNNTQRSIQATYLVPTNKTGTNTINVGYTYFNSTSSSSTFQVSMNINSNSNPDSEISFCPNGQIGSNLSLDNIDISTSGDEEDEWKFLDVITVEVRVKNTGNDDVDNVVVEMALFDSTGDDVSSDLDFLNEDEEQIEIGDLNEDDKETVTFEFEVPAGMDMGDYKLAFRTYSDDISDEQLCDDSSSDLSNDVYESIEIIEEEDEGRFIAFDNIQISSDQLTCSESVTLDVEVFNVGEDDQDRVLITLYNDQLGIEQSYEIKSELETGDSEDVTFNFVIPQDANDGDYDLFLAADYSYDDGNYEESLDEDDYVPITVIGCDVDPNVQVATITSNYDSATAGSDLIVEATIRNIADESRTFLIDLDDYSSWAQLVTVSDRTLDLESGESQTITITLNVNDDASSQESFTINAVSDGNTESEAVDVVIEPNGFSLNENAWIWVIAIINLILIILIIIVAVRLSRR